MKNCILLLLCCLYVPGFAQSPKKVVVSGYVLDLESGEPLIGASVAELYSQQGAYTNHFGFFSIPMPPAAQYCLLFRYGGYKEKKTCLSTLTDTLIKVYLPFHASTDTVLIEAAQRLAPELGKLQISTTTIEKLPILLGEKDVLKSLQILPGIKMGAEGSAGLHVRGGSPDQNLILLDDVPLYYVNHLAGLFSLFDPGALSQATVYKGIFPAAYHGRTASIIDLRMKEGNKRKHKHYLSLGLMSLKARTEGPIKPDTASYLFSGRLSNILPVTLASNLLNKDGFATTYYFYDLYGKVNYQLNSKDKLQLSLYAGEDKLKFGEKTPGFKGQLIQKWGNQLAALRWSRIWGSSLFSNLTIATTRFFYDTKGQSAVLEAQEVVEQNELFLSTGISDLIAKMDIEWAASPRHFFKMGIKYIPHTFRPAYLKLHEQDVESGTENHVQLGNKQLKTTSLSVYAEDEIKLFHAWILRMGAAISTYQSGEKKYLYPEPRLSLHWAPGESLRLQLAYAYMVQYLHLLSNSRLGLPTDVWVPATAKVPPQYAHQWSAGASWQFPASLSLNIEAYYKTLGGLNTYLEGSNLLTATDEWENALALQGKGEAYGLEILLEKNSGATTGWFGYTFAVSTRQFDQINNGKPFPYNYDRRHEVSLLLLHRFHQNLSLSALWTLSSGRPFTFATSVYDLRSYDPTTWRGVSEPDESRPHFFQAEYYTARNNIRLPTYHRLDLSLQFYRQRAFGERTFTVGVYNIYSRKNPYMYFYRRELQGDDGLKQVSLFPFLPYINFAWTF